MGMMDQLGELCVVDASLFHSRFVIFIGSFPWINFVVIRVNSWIVCLRREMRDDPQNKTNGHEQELNKRNESEK